MKFTQAERQSIMTWRLKMALMVDQAFMADVNNAEAEVTSLHIAMLEMAIAGMRTIEDQTGTMTVLNQVMYDMFDAEDEPNHWRHKENSRIIDIYTNVMRECGKQAR